MQRRVRGLSWGFYFTMVGDAISQWCVKFEPPSECGGEASSAPAVPVTAAEAITIICRSTDRRRGQFPGSSWPVSFVVHKGLHRQPAEPAQDPLPVAGGH